MSHSLPTVKIKHPGGYAIINESEFNPDKHQLYAEREDEAAAGNSAPEKAAPEKADDTASNKPKSKAKN